MFHLPDKEEAVRVDAKSESYSSLKQSQSSDAKFSDPWI